MKNIFKQLIIDFQEQGIAIPSPREFLPFTSPKGVRKAFVLVGMRRSGKTWSLYQQMHYLLDQGIEHRQLLYLNFEDDRLIGTKAKDLQSILDVYFELFPDVTESHFFFDEIHEVEGWEKFIRRLLDTEKMQIYLTGSSAKMLSKEIATSLRGRAFVREVFPYNFREYLTAWDEPYTGRLTTKRKAQLNHFAQQYLQWGGFPEVYEIDDPSLHREILQGYIDTVIYRDIIERYQVMNVHVLRKLLTHCLQNPASLFSINKMYQVLKSQGYTISKNSLYTFMEYFEDAYCIFSIPAFNLSARKASLKPRKIYPIDPGLITAYSIEKDFQQGPAFEALVFSILRRQVQQLYYFLTKSGQEVDFFVTYPDQSKSLIQVALSLKDPATRKREISALQQAMEETGIDESYIITMDETENISANGRMIHVIPLLKFLLTSTSGLSA